MKTLSEQVLRGRAEESLGMMRADLDWMNAKLMQFSGTFTEDEREDLRHWFKSCLEKLG